MIVLQGFIYSLIIIKVAPRLFKDGFNKKNLTLIYGLFAAIHFSLLAVFLEKSLVEMFYISAAVGVVGLLGSVLYKLIEDKYGK